MTAKREVDISALIEQGDVVREAVRRGGLEAMKIHIRAGEPMVSWKDGKVVFIPPAALEKMLAEAEQDGIMQSGGGILTDTIVSKDQTSRQERPMSTITKDAFISKNHKLSLDLELPANIPTGSVVITLTVKAKEAMQTTPDSDSELEHFMNSPLFGVWGDREDISDPSEWVRSIRKPRHPDLSGEGCAL